MSINSKPLKRPIERLSQLFKKMYQRGTSLMNRFPVLSFLILLAVLVGLIVLSSVVRTPTPVIEQKKAATKKVSVYRVGKAPRIKLQAQVEKSGVIQITSLMGGVVQTIQRKEGERVNKGESLIWLSTNYQGGNAFSVQREMAQKQYENVKDTYEKQKDIIDIQRDIAKETNTNTEKLREITSQSVGETQNVVNLNNDILSTLNDQLGQFTASNSAGQNNQAILALKGQINQVQAANLQLNSSLRNAQYQSSDSNPPAELSDLQKKLALAQLEVQERALKLSKEISRLQLQLAQVNEALMYPSAPFAGTIQRVFVKVGQAIQPGVPLFTLSQDVEDDPIVAIAYAPREIAQSISMIEESTLYFANQTLTVYPSFVTNDAIQGSLYGIYFPIPDNFNRFVTDKGYIEVEIPIGYFDTTSAFPFIPIDSVYQTQTTSYVFVTKNGKAVARNLTLGPVVGSFVQVENGLLNGDAIILDRTVVAGDTVTILN